MNNINKKYRVIPEMYKDKKGEWDFIKHNMDDKGKPILSTDNSFVYCYNGKAQIYRYDKDILCCLVFSSQVFNKTVETLGSIVIDSWLLDGEGQIFFKNEDLDIVCKAIKAKPQRQSKLAIHNKANTSYWERAISNVK